MGKEHKLGSDNMRSQSGGSGKRQPVSGERDSLTGILKKDVAEAQMAAVLNRERTGTLFLCEVSDLKKINSQYGHLAGDECLKEAARILAYMIHADDIFGRRGGNEFLIFMPDCRETGRALETCRRIEDRFRTRRGNGKIPFALTAVCAVWRQGDTCKRLFLRAEEELGKRKVEAHVPDAPQKERRDQYIKDARRIRKELIEQIRKPGAYCQDYETFKGIYRFLERGIIRSGQKVCVILLTVVDGQGRSILPVEKDVMMGRLGEDIGETLRIGDVYTRYSSSQYLILVIDTTEGQADLIVERIKSRFLADSQGNDILIHHCYELQPARIGGNLEEDLRICPDGAAGVHGPRPASEGRNG